jgi:hypothetical protein
MRLLMDQTTLEGLVLATADRRIRQMKVRTQW